MDVTWYFYKTPTNQSESNRPIKIAILDSGLTSSEHDNIVHYEVLKSKNTYDEYGHGTGVFHVLREHLETTRIWDTSEIYSIKVMDNKGNVTKNDFIDGLKYAIEQNVDVVNISFGFNHDDKRIKAIIERAIDEGIVVVGAAGNKFGMQSDYPARYENVISVNAYDISKDRIPRYAAKGKIDFVAPGEEVSTQNQSSENVELSGSSFATPYITAIVASYLSQERNENKSFDEMVNDLSGSATVTKGMNGKEEYIGFGMPKFQNKGE